jgi:2-methylcitrate synthase
MSVKDIKPASAAFKPKKSVALSGTTAGETAVCTVGNSGNDLHYRGYDIRDLPQTADLKRWPTCWSTGNCPIALSLPRTRHG